MVSKSTGAVVFPLEEHVGPLHRGARPRDVFAGNGIIISPPRAEVWLRLMENIIYGYNSTCSVTDNTGPGAVTTFLETHGCESQGSVRLSKQLYGGIRHCTRPQCDDPLAKLSPGGPVPNAKAVAVHHEHGGWTQLDDGRLRCGSPNRGWWSGCAASGALMD